MEIDLRRFRIADRKIVRSRRNLRKSARREPIAPQIFWVAGIALLLVAEALIVGRLASTRADMHCASQLASRGGVAQLRVR